MNNKRKQLYDNLIGTGRVSNAEIGTLDEFRKAIKDEQTARQFHKNLLGAGFTSDEIGSEDDFYNSISSDFDVQGKAQSSNEPYTHVYDKDMNLIGGTAYQAPEPYQYKPEVQQHIVENIPDMFKPKTGNLVDRPAGISATEEPKFDVTNAGKSFAETVNDAYETSNEMGERLNARIGMLEKNAKDPIVQKGRSEADMRGLTTEIDSLLESEHKKLKPNVSVGQKGLNAIMGSNQYNQSTKDTRKNVSNLEAAKRLMEQSKYIVDAAHRGDTGVLSDTWQGFKDSLEAEDFTFGLADMSSSAAILDAIKKVERGEKLTPSEDKLLKASAINMAIQYNFANDLGRAYKAGQVSAESVPFMLEMAINPISSFGKASAKTLLNYGLKAYAKQVGKGLLKGAAAGAGMAATTGAGRVASGAMDKLAGNYNYGVDMNGNLYAEKKENTMGVGEAVARSFASTAIENQSEMIFNAFKGLGGFMKGVNDVLPGGVNRFFDMLSHNKVADAYRWLKNSKVFRNYLVKDIRNATQIGGLGEEYLEEVYNNLANFAIGEMSWEDVTSLDKNIDTLLGLAPTQVMFGILGLGGAGVMRYQTRRTLEDLQATMNEQQRRELEGLLDMGIDAKETDVRGFIRSVMANQNYTVENKRDLIKAAYYVAKQKGIDEMAEADVVEKVNAEYSLIDSMTDPSTGTYAEVNRLVINPETGEREAQPGYVVGWVGEGDKRQPIFVADGMENTYENRMVLKPTEWEKESYQEMPAEQVKTVSEEMIRDEAAQQAEQEAKYAPEVLNEQMQQGVPFNTPTSQIVPVAPMPEGNGWIVEEYALDTNNKVAKTPIVRELTNDEYRDMLQAQVEAQEAAATPMSPMESQEPTPRTPMSTPMTENVQPVAEGVATQPQAAQPKQPTLEDVVATLPKTNKGEIDYKAMTPQQQFQYTSLTESPEVALEDLQTDIAAGQEEIAKKQEKLAKAIGGERTALRDEVRKLTQAQAELQSFYDSVAPIQEVVEETAQPVDEAVKEPTAQAEEAAQPQPEVTEEQVAEQPSEEVAPEVVPEQVEAEEQSDNTGGTPEESEETHEEGEDVKSPIRERAKDWENKLGVKVNLIESIDQVTNREALRAIQNGQRVTGWFEESTGEVCFYVPYLESENEVDSTYIHEVVAHKGLRGLLGDKFDAFCDEVWESMSVMDKAKFITYPGVNGNKRAAADEYIAHLAENIDVTDSAWSQFTELIKKFLKAIGLEPKMTNADIANTIKKSYQRLLESGAEGNRMPAVERIDENVGEVDAEKGDVRFAVRDVLKGEEREQAIKDLMAVTGRSRSTVVKWLKAEESLASVILNEDNVGILDMEADESVPSIWKNSDYPQGTVEFSNICKKRLPFTTIYQRLQKEFPDTLFDAQTLNTIRNTMKEMGEDVACALCFVEDRRQLLGEIGQGFIDAVKGMDVEVNDNQKAALDKLRESGDKYVPNLFDIITLDGMKELRKKHPAVAQAFIEYNNARGMQSGRLFQAYSAYNREILKYNKKKVKSINNNGGLRIFSFSDFEAHHLIDLVQVLTDCAAKGIKVQGYTKVPEFAKAVKDTNAKINRSLIPKGVGYVDADYVPKEGEAVSPNVINGKRLLFDTIEGIDVNNPNFFDSTGSKSVGNILVAINDEHARLAMADPFVDYIIGFHTGQSKAILKGKGIDTWVNYKNEQLDKEIVTDENGNQKTKNAPHHGLNIYTDVLNVAEAEGNPIKTAKQFTERFIEECNKRGWIPRFHRFLNRAKDGRFLYTPGYHKFLIDFKLFDKNGKILPQEAVVPKFDDAFNKQILDDYVKGVKEEMPNDAVYEAVKDAIGLGEGTRFRTLEEVNQTFNEYLQKQIDGVLPQGYVYSLGNASDILRSAGIPYLPIEMASSRLSNKSNQENHPFELSEITDLPKAIQNPLAVFDSATRIGSNVILTELKQGNKNFVVAIETNRRQGKIYVNSVRSIHPRTTNNIVNWINEGLLGYANKETLKEWLDEKIKTKDYLNSSNPADVRKSLVSAANIVKDFQNPTLPEEKTSFRVVTDKNLIDKLESEPKIKVYRAMQLVDGKLYPPMSAKVDGKMREPIELGKWEMAEERPDLADERGYFKLDKGNKSSLKARYNPYIHTSTTPLNDQFSSAQSRPELVTVEVEVPESELTSGYKAEKAKDAVGKVEWKAGVVQGKLSGTRTVILSRYDKPIRIVPDSEVADEIVKMFGGKDITMPSNVVTPSLRAELEKRGVPFVETDNQGKAVGIRFRVKSFETANEELDKDGISINNKELMDEYGLSDITLSKSGNHVTLSKVVVGDKGKGNGTRFMEDLTNNADNNGWILALTPDTSFGGSSVARLKKFYKRFGFKDNKGRNTDFETRESMVRPVGGTRFRVVGEPAIDYVSQANDVVEVPKDEVMYTMNNIAPQLYKTSGRFMRQLYKYGTIGRVLKGEYAEIDQIKAKQEYDHAKPILEEYLNELVWMKYQATEAAQEVINDVISDVEYAMQYYKDLSLGKDVWRTQSSPRFRISDYGKQVKAEVDKVSSKYNGKEVMFFDSEMTDEEIDSIIPGFTMDDVQPMFDDRILGGYTIKLDKISIFANNIPIDNVEDTLFHENLHALLQNGQSIIDAFAENALERFPKNVKRIQERGYDEEEVAEELLVRLVAKAMVYGIFDDVAYNLPESEFENLKVLLKDFGYEYEQEIKSRALAEGRRGTPTLLGGEEIHETRGVRQDTGEQTEEKRTRKEQLGKLLDQVADMGLEGVLGNKEYTSAMVDIYKALPNEVRAELAEDALRNYGGSVAPAVSDYLNVKAEPSVWDKVVTIVREALRKVGFDLDLNANEVRYMVWRSKKPLDRNNLLEVAEDIDMKNRLKVGEYDGSPTPDGGGTRFRRVYHGSGASFDKFDHSFMGTGEGAQAYGCGTYVTEVGGIARSYATTMASKSGVDPLSYVGDYENYVGKDAINIAKEYMRRNSFDLKKAKEEVEHDLKLTMPALSRKGAEFLLGTTEEDWAYNPNRHLYEVEIPDDNGKNYLYWDKQYTRTELEDIASRSKGAVSVDELDPKGVTKDGSSIKGGKIVRAMSEARGPHMVKAKEASKKLSLCGFVGIEYPAEFRTGGREDNAKNYVIFDEKDLKIKEHTRFRVTNKLKVRDEYEATIKKGGYQAREAVQDAMLSLRRFQELIEKATGEKIRDFENAWMHENRLSSVVQAKIHDMERKFYKPMMDAVKKLMKVANLEQEQVADYLMLKHGIERNREMAVRKALTDSEGKIDRTRLDQWYQDKEAIRNDASLDTWRKKQEAMDNAALNYGADMSRDYSGLTSMFDTDDIEECTKKAYDEVEALENAHPVETEALGKAIKAMTQNTLDESFGSGLMDRKVYNELSKDMYDYYIPLRGFEETTSDEVYAYLDQDRGAFNAPLKRAKGRSSKSDNPIAYLKSIAESGLMQGERNKMKQSFLNLVINHPSDLVSVREGVWVTYNPASGEWEVATPPTIPNDATPADVEAAMEAWEQQMEQAALKDPTLVKKVAEAADVPYRVVGNKMGQHQIIVKRLGKSYTLTINGNPRLAMALNGQTNPNNTSNDGKVAAFVNNKIGSINRSLAAWYTTRNPDFVASNFMRDTFYTNTIVRAKEGNAYANKFHKHYATVLPKMISLFSKYEKGTLNPADPTESAFIDFMMNGGETGYSNLKDVEEIKKQIAKELKGNRFAKVEELAEKLDILNRAVENTARFAAYLTSREVGRSIAKSIFDAKEISVNFNKKGAGGTFFGMTGQTWFGNLAAMVGASGRALYVFFNAAIQGSTNLMHVMKVNPKGTSAGLAAMFLMGAVVPFLFGDDDDEKDYYDLPEHVRRNHLIIPGAGDAWISIPLPIEYRIMYGIGELLTSWRTGHERGTDIARKMLSMTGQALPLNFLEEGLEAFVPSAVSPIYQVMTNSSWTGLPIYKENDFNKDDPEYTKAYSNVDRNLLKFTKALYEWTFDEENQEEGVDLNPAIIETLAKGYFGGLATQLSNLAKVGGMIAGEQEFDWRNIPIGNRILKTGDERTKEKRVNNEYFENMEKLGFLQSRERTLKKTEKGVAVPETDKFNAHKDLETMKGTEVYKKYQEFKKLKKKVDKIRKTMKEKGSTPEREKQLMEAQEAANKVVR